MTSRPTQPVRGRRSIGLACVVLSACGADRVQVRPWSATATSSDAGSSAGELAAGDAELAEDPPCQQVSVREFVPEAARFAPGTWVSLRARLTAGDIEPCTTTLELEVTHVGDIVYRETQRVAVISGIEQTAVLRFEPPPEDFRGYMARLSSPASLDELNTGIDVSSTPYVFPRYGYVSTFPSQQLPARSQELIRSLAESYHINLFQLYDWFWRHEDLLPREEYGAIDNTWPDLFGRVNSRATLKDVVDAIHSENAAAMAYVAMYAARENFEQLSGVSRAWGLFNDSAAAEQVSLAFGEDRRLFLFDPQNAAWQAHMTSQYVEAINSFGFDGVHIDQFGPRPTLYRANGSPVELRDTFAPFLEAVDAALESNDPRRAACIFNIVEGGVDGYGVSQVASTPACNVLYSEIWFTTETYEGLRAYVEQLRALGGGRSVVLAMYPHYGQEVGTVFEAEEAELHSVTIDSDHPGFTGAGFVDEFDAIGDGITWSIDSEEDSTVTFVFRYANATGQVATRTLLIDDEPIGKLKFGSRASWDDWSFDAWLQQALPAGRHEARLSYAADDVGAVNIDRLTLGEFDEASVRLQNAVVFASGATPIQLGDDLQSLSHEYFPNRSKTLRASLRAALRAQYAFITAHETLLFPADVRPIEARLTRVSATSEGHRLITEGSGGVWTLLRSTPAGDVIHLVNLVGVNDARWRDPTSAPIVQERIRLTYQLDDPSAVREVLWATPDQAPGTFERLAFTHDDGGVQFEVPRLAYWDVVLIRR